MSYAGKKQQKRDSSNTVRLTKLVCSTSYGMQLPVCLPTVIVLMLLGLRCPVGTLVGCQVGVQLGAGGCLIGELVVFLIVEIDRTMQRIERICLIVKYEVSIVVLSLHLLPLLDKVAHDQIDGAINVALRGKPLAHSATRREARAGSTSNSQLT